MPTTFPGDWQFIQSFSLLKTQTGQKFLDIRGILAGFV